MCAEPITTDVMPVEVAENVLKSVPMLEQLAGSDALALMGFDIDRNALSHMYKDARIVVLEHDVDEGTESFLEVVDSLNAIEGDLMESLEDREHLREDVARLLTQNAKQAEVIAQLLQESAETANFLNKVEVKLAGIINSVMSAGEYIESDTENVRYLQGQTEKGDRFKIWNANTSYKVGDVIVIDGTHDLESNGTYVMHADGVFYKRME